MLAITIDTHIHKMAAICIACGNHHKVDKRHNLQASKDVLQLWEFLFCSLLQSRVLLDGILRDVKIEFPHKKIQYLKFLLLGNLTSTQT